LPCRVTVAARVVPDSGGAGASLRDVLAAALDANREMARLAAVLREENARLRAENARLRAENAEQAAELERVRADLAVLQRMVFGRSSERARPEPSADGGDAGQGRDLRGSGTGGKKRGPGARAGRRDYPHLPRVEVAWDFPGGGYCCPECGTPFTGLGSDHVTEQLDWLVIVRVRADCRRRYRRACSCQVPATVTAPGPPKATGKGLSLTRSPRCCSPSGTWPAGA
jgi:transposase